MKGDENELKFVTLFKTIKGKGFSFDQLMLSRVTVFQFAEQ